MGCTESLPQPTSYNVVHKIDPAYPAIGGDAGAGPSPDVPIRIVVREKLFSWSGDDFRIKHHPDGRPLGNGLKMKGKVFAFRDQMALVDGDGKMVAVCLRKFELIGQTFKIYLPNPIFSGQKPSGQNYNGKALYTYGEVKRVPLSTTQIIVLEGKTSPTYSITRVGSWWPKKRIVKKNDIPAALMEGGTWEGNWNSYKITINPGIDPCLMICVCAICDEMDEDR